MLLGPGRGERELVFHRVDSKFCQRNTVVGVMQHGNVTIFSATELYT